MKYRAHTNIHICVHAYAVSPCSLIPSYHHRNRAGDEYDVVRLALRAPAAFRSLLALLFHAHVPAPAALGLHHDSPVLTPTPSMAGYCCHHLPHTRPAPV